MKGMMACVSARCSSVTLADIKGPAERWCLHDEAGRKPVLLSRALVIDNAITLPRVRARVVAFQAVSV